ncbi:MAG: STAS domain-containing protein [PVC group bacterium]
MTLQVSVTEKDPGVFVVSPIGSIDTSTAPILGKEVADLLARSPRLIIFDMAGVEYISSMGVREVIKTKKGLAGRGGRFAMINVTPSIQRVFEIINALPPQEIFESIVELDDYLAAMQKKVHQGEE